MFQKILTFFKKPVVKRVLFEVVLALLRDRTKKKDEL